MNPSYSKTQPYLSHIIERHTLCPASSSKQVYHVRLDLSHAPFHFESGDSIGVLPDNPLEEVSAILHSINASGSETILSRHSQAGDTLLDVLTKKVNLKTVTRKLIDWAISSTKNGSYKAALQSLIQNEGESIKEWTKERHVLDVLIEGQPFEGSFEVFLEALLPLMPRFYSVASSPKNSTRYVDLLVADIAYDLQNMPRKGVASWHLCHQITTEKSLPIYNQSAPHFRLAQDSQTPIIMIGPGTGIAPYRAFMQERLLQGAEKNWLFFGERHREEQYFYRPFWEDLEKKGVLKLTTAFSRDQAEKIYVQHRMKEESSQLFQWIQDGAMIYVCGDAHHMAKEVEKTLTEIVEKEGALSQEDAREYIKQLRKSHRYMRDVY